MAGLVSSDTLGPGESGTVRVTLNPAGKFGTSMPGYLKENGGPLTGEQVDSLVSLVVGP